jgi:hypothetical protein
MHCYLHEIPLDEGFTVLFNTEPSRRLVQGKQVNRPSGFHLFAARWQSKNRVKCVGCGVEADRWVAIKGEKDRSEQVDFHPYAPTMSGIVRMTQDHIIPKSLGGVDHLDNLRVMCSTCNLTRGNSLARADLEFARTHPELIDPERLAQGIARMKYQASHMGSMYRLDDVIEAVRPFILMGYI